MNNSANERLFGNSAFEALIKQAVIDKDDAYTSAVVWDMDGYRFCVGAKITIEDLLEMARSVQKTG